MKISLSPQLRDSTLVVSKSGDLLTINGDVFDFTGLPDGATIPEGSVPCDWIVGPIHRVAGELHLTLILPHGSNPEQWQAFPDDLVAVPDGLIDLPIDTTVDVERTPTPGGFIITTKTRRWHQPDQVEVAFEAAQEEAGNVDA